MLQRPEVPAQCRDTLFSDSYKGIISLKRILWAGLCTFKTEDAFRAVLSPAGVVGHVNVHRADTFAGSAGNALVVIALDAD